MAGRWIGPRQELVDPALRMPLNDPRDGVAEAGFWASNRRGRPIMPDAWPSIRSTARWVSPVLVGPGTATNRDGACPEGRWLMVRMWVKNR